MITREWNGKWATYEERNLLKSRSACRPFVDNFRNIGADFSVTWHSLVLPLLPWKSDSHPNVLQGGTYLRWWWFLKICCPEVINSCIKCMVFFFLFKIGFRFYSPEFCKFFCLMIFRPICMGCRPFLAKKSEPANIFNILHVIHRTPIWPRQKSWLITSMNGPLPDSYLDYIL